MPPKCDMLRRTGRGSGRVDRERGQAGATGEAAPIAVR